MARRRRKAAPGGRVPNGNGDRSAHAGRGWRRREGDPDWVGLTDEELLGQRFCDLQLQIAGTWLEAMVARLHAELDERGIGFKPHCWLSNEWFSPDGIPGIAIPFYLAHPRLMKLEERQVLEVEGGTRSWCMKILRHEAGHAIDTAYGLRRRRGWQAQFGRASEPYPDTYRPKPHSRKYVLHLAWWYAQSHPVEDFAETFAVWLKPRSRWRTDYAGWPALKKLEYVDEVLREAGSKPARETTRRKLDTSSRSRRTLRSHYAQKRERYGIDLPDFYDLHLRRLFADPSQTTRKAKAVVFLRKHDRELREVVSRWTGHHPYTVEQFLKEMTKRSKALDLRLVRSEQQTKMDTAVLLAVQVMRYLQSGGYRITL